MRNHAGHADAHGPHTRLRFLLYLQGVAGSGGVLAHAAYLWHPAKPCWHAP